MTAPRGVAGNPWKLTAKQSRLAVAWMKTYIRTETAFTGHLTAEELGAYDRRVGSTSVNAISRPGLQTINCKTNGSLAEQVRD
jgi:hypothetical protein